MHEVTTGLDPLQQFGLNKPQEALQPCVGVLFIRPDRLGLLGVVINILVVAV